MLPFLDLVDERFARIRVNELMHRGAAGRRPRPRIRGA
jgi:hypothetical protein